MTDLRVLVTGRTEAHIVSRLRRATEVLRHDLDAGDAEVVVMTRSAPRHRSRLATAIAASSGIRHIAGHGTDEAHLLDIGLHLRPLPTVVAVVGDRSHWLPDVLISFPLLLGAKVAAAVAHDAHDIRVRGVLRQGGVFAAGPLCVAGGFSGDGQRPIAERLAALGYSTLELPSSSSRYRARRHRGTLPVTLGI